MPVGKKQQETEAPAAPPAPHSIAPETVVVHPLVLLSVVDHYNRVALQSSNRRVVGILLGETYKGRVDVSNSFAVPFEEDNDDAIWFFDHDYAENMFHMFAKVNAKERIVGFYSTGPKLRGNDLAIDADFRTRYCAHSVTPPILCIIDVRPDLDGVPTQAYYSIEQISDEDKSTRRTFKHIASEVGAYEAEEVGVEHLLRDINDPTISTLASRVRQKMTGLRGLKSNLQEMHRYLSNVAEGRLPVNHRIIDNLQEIVNLLPNLNAEELVSAYLVKSNDMNLVIYVASLVRAIVALHNLLANKLQLKEDASGTTKKDGEKKDGEKKDTEKKDETKKEDKKSSN